MVAGLTDRRDVCGGQQHGDRCGRGGRFGPRCGVGDGVLPSMLTVITSPATAPLAASPARARRWPLQVALMPTASGTLTVDYCRGATVVDVDGVTTSAAALPTSA